LFVIIAGDITNWMNSTSGEFNATGLEWNMKNRAGMFYGRLVARYNYRSGSLMCCGSPTVGYPVPWDWIATNVKRAQDYLIHNTTLGIPALVQTECTFSCRIYLVRRFCLRSGALPAIHGFLIGNATIYNSPIAYACSFNPEVSPSPVYSYRQAP
jgi:beta-glucosidase